MEILERLKKEFPKHTIDTKKTFILLDEIPTLIEYRNFIDIIPEDLERYSTNILFSGLKQFIKDYII